MFQPQAFDGVSGFYEKLTYNIRELSCTCYFLPGMPEASSHNEPIYYATHKEQVAWIADHQAINPKGDVSCFVTTERRWAIPSGTAEFLRTNGNGITGGLHYTPKRLSVEKCA